MKRSGDLVSNMNIVARRRRRCATAIRTPRVALRPRHQNSASSSRQILVHSLRLCVSVLACDVAGQTLDERLDEEKFLRGLSEYALPEVLDHYITEHPPADAVDALIYALTVQRMRLADESLTPAQHRDAIEQVLATREEMLSSHPADPRHAVWLAEQAADLLFGLYPLEAAGLASEFGLVSPGHRAQAAKVAEQIFTMASDAELEIEEIILNLEGEPGYQDDIAAQLRRRRLARDERDRRIPFLRGAGEYLHALHNQDDDPLTQREGFEAAAELLEPLIPELDGLARTRAQVYTGLALARLGRSEAASEHFRAVKANANATPIDLFAARMGEVLDAEVSRGHAAALEALAEVERAYSSPDALFFRILAADRRFLIRRSASESAAPSQRAAMLRVAFEEYLRILDTAGSTVPPETLRGIVYAKLASAVDESMPIDQLPPIAMVALAENMARDEYTREEAIQLFHTALQQDNLDPQARASALFGLARAYYDDENWLEAARRFDQIARELPADPQAPKAIEIAASLLMQLRESAPDAADVSEQLERTLALLVEEFPEHPELERWRFELGRLHLDLGATEAARSMFLAIPPDAAVWPDAMFMLAQLARDESAAPGAAANAHERAMAEAAAARAAMQPALAAAEQGDEVARAGWLRDSLVFLDVFEAESLLALGRAEEALQKLADFEGGSHAPRAALADALSLRIRAYQLTGRQQEARAEVDRFIESIPDEIDTVVPAMMQSIASDIAELNRQGQPDRARQRAIDDLIPMAEALTAWISRSSVETSRRIDLEIEVANAYRLAERHLEAFEAYERVLREAPDLLPAILGRAEALFAQTRYEEAIGEYKRISAARSEARDDAFWRSELRMLQVLDLVNRNTHQIGPRILRLRATDPSFGGYERDFAVLENKYPIR